MTTSDRTRPASRLVSIAAVFTLGACAQRPPTLVTPPAYHLLPVDEAMSCEGIADSFAFAARRAARLQYWLEVGPIAGFGNARFEEDAPLELHDEQARLDALSDLQREKGCRVSDPAAAVAYERSKYPPLAPPPVAPPPVAPPPVALPAPLPPAAVTPPVEAPPPSGLRMRG